MLRKNVTGRILRSSGEFFMQFEGATVVTYGDGRAEIRSKPVSEKMHADFSDNWKRDEFSVVLDSPVPDTLEECHIEAAPTGGPMWFTYAR